MHVGIVIHEGGHAMFVRDLVVLRKVLQIGVALSFLVILWRKRASEFGTLLNYVRTNPALWVMEVWLMLEWLIVGEVLNVPRISFGLCVAWLSMQSIISIQAIRRQGRWRRIIVSWTLALTFILCMSF